MAGRGLHQQAAVRRVAVPEVVDDRDDDRDRDALLHADEHDARRGDAGHGEFEATHPVDAAHAVDVHQVDTDHEHDRGERRQREVGQRPGEQDEDEQHHNRRTHLGQLAASARAVRDLRLGRAAVDDEGPGERRREVRDSEPHEVGVLVHVLLVARRVRPRSRGALRQDHDEHRQRDRQQFAQVLRGE